MSTVRQDPDDRYVLRHDHHFHHHRGHDNNSNITEDTRAARRNVIEHKRCEKEGIVGLGHLSMKRKVLSKYKASCCKAVQSSIRRMKAAMRRSEELMLGRVTTLCVSMEKLRLYDSINL